MADSRQSAFLVVGGDGRIGAALAGALRSSKEDLFETFLEPRETDQHRIRLDLRNDPARFRVPTGVTTAFLGAAVTSLAECRTHPVETALVNVEHTVILAERLVEAGAHVIVPSSSLVFDGSRPLRGADDPVSPLTAYGRQKAETERRLLKLGPGVTILRMTKVVSPEMPLFSGWMESLRDGRPIRPFSNMVFSPVPLSFVIEAIRLIAGKPAGGILQISGDRDLTYADAAFHIADRLGAARELVEPRSIVDSGLECETNPAHTTLDVSRLQSEFGITPPPVLRALEGLLT